MTSLEPVLVEVTRGDMVENTHRGSIVVMDAASQRILWGEEGKRMMSS